jgi:hypothetical protein
MGGLEGDVVMWQSEDTTDERELYHAGMAMELARRSRFNEIMRPLEQFPPQFRDLILEAQGDPGLTPDEMPDDYLERLQGGVQAFLTAARREVWG